MGRQRWRRHTSWHEPETFRRHCVQLACLYRFFDRRSPKRVQWYRTRCAQKVIADPHQQTKLWILNDSQSFRARLKGSKHPNTSNNLQTGWGWLRCTASQPTHPRICTTMNAGYTHKYIALHLVELSCEVMQIRKDMSEQDMFCLGGMLPHYESTDSNRLIRRKTTNEVRGRSCSLRTALRRISGSQLSD